MENTNKNNSNLLIALLIILVLIMYGCYQEEKINNLERRIEKIETYTKYFY